MKMIDRAAGMALAALLLLNIAGLAAAQAPAVSGAEPVPIERFFQRPAVLEAKLSPSGNRLALTTSRGVKRVALAVIDLGAKQQARRVALFSELDVVSFDWASDDRLVFSVRDLAAGSGEDRYAAPGLFSVNAAGGELKQLVRRWQPMLVDGSSRADALEWNHVLLRVPLQQPGVLPDEVVIGQMNFGNDNEPPLMIPMWLNVRTGRTRSLDTMGAPTRTQYWLFDSKGQPRLAASRREDRQRTFWRGPADKAWRQLADAELLHPPFIPVSVDDEGTLYVTDSEGAEGYSVLTRFDMATMKPSPKPVVRTPGFDFEGGLLLDRAGGRALGVRVNADGEQTVWFDEDMTRMQALANAHLPERVNRLSCRRCGAADMVVLVRSFSDRDPGQLWLYDAASSQWQAVSTVLDGIDPRRMAEVSLERIKARDGRDLPVWLTLPAGVAPGKPAPAVVMVHGGPWMRGGDWQWEPWEQFLASRGYLVISPEFRGSTGYGDAHYRAGWKQWGQAMQDDVADALLWARRQGLADPDKACIAGASYGGYATLMGLVRDPALYRCGVAWVAVTDPMLMLGGSWWVDDDVSNSGRRYVLPELVGDVNKDAAMLKAASPLAQAARIKAPLLLGVGEADRRVPPVHAERLRDAMRAAGNPPEWVSYPEEGHSWRQVATNVDFARRMERFLATQLKP